MQSRFEEALERIKQKQPREARVITHPEDDLQKSCVKWFREYYEDIASLLFHPNNEAYLGKGRTRAQQERAGKRAKDMGVTAGVADLILLYPGRHGEHALCIEMKSCRGTQEPSQKEWQKAVEARGYRYEICKSLQSFQGLIEDFTGRKPANIEQVAIRRIFGDKSVKIHGR